MRWRGLAYSILIGAAVLFVSAPLFQKVYLIFGIFWTALILGALLVVGLSYVVAYLRRVYRQNGATGILEEARFAGRVFAPLAGVVIGLWLFSRIGVHIPSLIAAFLIFGCIMYANGRYQDRSLSRGGPNF